MVPTRPLGQSGIEASVVILGTWAIGGWMWGGTEEDESIKAIHASIDAGLNCIDTAPIYGFGESEEIVGKAIKGKRDNLVIATKCGMVWDRTEGDHFFDSDGKSIYLCNNPDAVRNDVENSLRRLGIDTIDLLQTHWQETTTPIEDTMATLMDLKKEGKIRAIGVCNATSAQMKQYNAAGTLDTDQEKYSMIDRDIESDQLPYCRENNMAVLAYSPLALGLLTGKVTQDREFPEGDLRKDNPRFTPENRQTVNNMLKEFEPIQAQHQLTTAQLVIAWTIHQPGLTHALVGARNPHQAIENAKAASVQFDDAELETLNQIIRKHAPMIT